MGLREKGAVHSHLEESIYKKSLPSRVEVDIVILAVTRRPSVFEGELGQRRAV